MFIPLHGEIEISRRASDGRRRIRPLDRFVVDRGVHVEMIAGKHVQRGILGQREAKRLCVMRILVHRRQLIGRGHLRLDACHLVHALIIRVRQRGRNPKWSIENTVRDLAVGVVKDGSGKMRRKFLAGRDSFSLCQLD